jgi:hypothetical protein
VADFGQGLLSAASRGIEAFAEGDLQRRRMEAEMAGRGLIMGQGGKWVRDPAELAREKRQRMGEAQLKLLGSGYEVSPDMFDDEGNLVDSPKVNQEYLRSRNAGMGDPFGLRGMQAMKAQMDLEKALKEQKMGQKLPADKVILLQEGYNIPKELETVSQTLGEVEGSMGPVVGRLRSWNPYDTKAQAADANIRAASQMFGRFMEGGVLRKEDEEKYRKMFPAMSDTPEVAKAKLENVRRLLGEKQKQTVEAMKQSGYDVSGLQAPGQSYEPDVLEYASRHNISPERAKQIKMQRMGAR